MIAKGKHILIEEDVLKVIPEESIAYNFLGITKIPSCIKAPYREDKHPSVGIFYSQGRILYKDFGTNECGTIFELLGKVYSLDSQSLLNFIINNLKPVSGVSVMANSSSNKKSKPKANTTKIEVKIREYNNDDINYWQQYGIPISLLKKANIFAISHVFINNKVFKVDKLAYAFIENKDDNTTIKVYQPLSKTFKWLNSHKNNTISLWRLLPEQGDVLCICSSVKDALCLYANTNIPAIAPQGEGYSLSNSAINNLKERFKEIYIIFDNDEAGIKFTKKLSETTGFIPLYLNFLNKDISDYYKSLQNKTLFINQFKNLSLWKEQSQL